MTDENYEELTPEAPEETAASEDVSFTEISPEPVEADPAADPAPDPAPAPDLDPVEPSDPVEVVTVDELLDRLTSESQDNTQTEEPVPEEALPAEEAPMDSGFVNDLNPAVISPSDTVEIVDMYKVLAHLETIQQQTDEHPMMETPFEDYTVTEGLMLLIFVILLLDFFLNILRRWF